MKILGIDIGTYSIKVSEIDTATRSSSLTNFFELKLSLDPKHDQRIDIIDYLRKLNERHKENTVRFVFALPQTQVAFHRKTFPFRERYKLIKSLPFELEDDIPIDSEDLVVDIKYLRSGPTGSEVMAIATHCDRVSEILQLTKDAGIDPDIISVEGAAFSNLIEDIQEPIPHFKMEIDEDSDSSQKPQIKGDADFYIHLGHSHTPCLTYSDGILIDAQCIDWGGRDLLNRIAKIYDVSLTEAVSVLQSKGAVLMNTDGALPEQVHISEALKEGLRDLIQTLRIHIADREADLCINIKKIHISGGLSLLKNLCPYLTQTLELPVNRSKLLSQKNVTESVNTDTESIAIMSYGLGLEALKRGKNPGVNFRNHKAFLKENKAFSNFWQTWKVPIQLALAFYLIFFSYAVMKRSMARSQADTVTIALRDAARSQGLRGAQESYSGIQRYIRNQRRNLQSFDQYQSLEDFTPALSVLRTLSQHIPTVRPPRQNEGLEIIELTINYDTIVLEGFILGESLKQKVEETLGELAISLEKLEPKSRTQMPSQHFRYKLRVNRSSGGDV